MKELTKAEEQVMQYLWEIKKGFLKDIVDQFPEPKPAYTTILTVMQKLEKAGFIRHIKDRSSQNVASTDFSSRSEHNAQSGVPPMAAISLRFTAAIRRPREKGGIRCSRKCVPATCASQVKSKHLRPCSTTAVSSPTPCTTSGRI